MNDEDYGWRDSLTPILGIVAILSEIVYAGLEYKLQYTELPLLVVILGLIGGLAWKGQSVNENLDPLIDLWESR